MENISSYAIPKFVRVLWFWAMKWKRSSWVRLVARRLDDIFEIQESKFHLEDRKCTERVLDGDEGSVNFFS